MKIATILGTRPEIIKMSQLISLLDKRFDHTFILTGQHYSKEMVDVFLEELNIRQPDFFLNSQSSEYSILLPLIKNKVKNLDIDYVIVYGDTNSTLAAALAAQKYDKKLIHIEAGLRSFDKRMAEELVRVLVDHLSDILFPPTKLTAYFLELEGIKNDKYVVGNTIVDACFNYLPIAERKSKILNKLELEPNEYILATIHRAENTDDVVKLVRLLQALSLLEYPVVLPVHPRIKKRLSEFGYRFPESIKAIDPVGYFDMLKLIKNSKFVATDSGGLQEEAITLKVPCLTLRETTERWETISIGANFLVGSDPLLINYSAKMILVTGLKEKIKKLPNPYGDGKASVKIVEILENKLH